jgi:serine/threonine protein kinase
MDAKPIWRASAFRREARSIAGLQSPHTVYLYDFGVSPDGRFYYVMEHAERDGAAAMVRDSVRCRPDGRYRFSRRCAGHSTRTTRAAWCTGT